MEPEPKIKEYERC